MADDTITSPGETIAGVGAGPVLSGDWYRMLAEHATDVMLLVGPDDRYVWASPSTKEVLGWSPDDVVGRTVDDFVPADDLAEIITARPANDTRRYTVAEERWRCADGSYRWMSASARQLLDRDGDVVGRVVSLHDIAAQVAARTALAAAEAEYRRLAEHASDVVYQTSVEGIVQWVSPSVEPVLGWRPSTWIGASMWSLFAPEDVDRARRHRDVVLGGTTPHTFELRYLTADGGRRWMSVRPRPLLDQHGQVVGTVVGLRDCEAEVIARRAAATLSAGTAALVQAESEEQLLADMCQVAVDAGGYLLAWYARRTFDEGRTVTKVASSREHRDYVRSIEVSWGDGPLGQGPTGIALRTGVTAINGDHHTDERFRPWLAKAREHGFRSSISLPVFVEGELDGAFVVYAAESEAFDERARAMLEDLATQLGTGLRQLRDEELLVASEARYRLLAEHGSDIVCELGSDDLITWISPSVERILGWRPVELIGTSPFDLLTDDDRGRFGVYAGTLHRDDPPAVFEVSAAMAGGGRRWVSVSVRVVPSVDGTGSATVISVRDVHAEVTARQAAMALSDGNAELALVLADQQLQRSRNHELRNALNSAAGFVDLIRLVPGDPAVVAERADIAAKAIGLAVAMATDRSSAATGHTTARIVRVGDVVGTAVAMVTPLANQQHTTLEVSIGHDVCAIGDERFILQIVLNLLANAIKYGSSDTPIHVEVAAAVDPEQRPTAIIEVADHGAGIPADLLPRLFIPGDRLGRTDDAGTGLGLPISKLLAEQMGGSIDVRSSVGSGTTFRVSLPACP